MVLARREEVDQPAPDGHLAPALDHVGAGVAGRDQPLQQLLELDPVAGGHPHRVDHVQPGGERLHHRPGRHGQQLQPVGLRLAQAVEQAQAGGDGLGAGREPLVGQGLPGREGGRRIGAEEGGDVGRQGLGVGGGGGGDDHQPPAGMGDPGQQEGPGHVGDDHLGPGAVGPWVEAAEQLGEGGVVGPAVEQGGEAHGCPLRR